MHTLSQSSFLQALGYAIANSLWQAALLWLVAWLLISFFKFSSRTRYRIAITAQIAGFVWFITTLQFYYAECAKATANAQSLLQSSTLFYQSYFTSDQTGIVSYIAKAEMVLPYLSLAYLCLLCLLSFKWFKNYTDIQFIKTSGLVKADMNWRIFIANTAAQLAIKQTVNIYFSSLIKSPLTIGFLKPVILVPLATVNHLTTEQLEAVLLHELAHIKRADYLINLLLNSIETILFFNPFTRLLSRMIQKEREHCCDDWVLQFQYNASMYAEALLRIASLQSSPVMAMKAEGQRGGELLWRVKRLLNHQQKKFSYRQQLFALLITTIILFSVAWLQPTVHSQTIAQAFKPKALQAVVTLPKPAEAANLFFNPLVFIATPLKQNLQDAALQIAKENVGKIAIISLDAAGKALAKATPAVLDELNKMNLDSNFKNAAAEAQKGLADVKWNEMKKVSPFIDSAFISQAVKLALDKNKLHETLAKVKESLAQSHQQMAMLKKQNLTAYINKDFVNAAIDNAISQIDLNDVFKNLQPEPDKNSKPQKAVKPRLLLKQEYIKPPKKIKQPMFSPDAGVYNFPPPPAPDITITDSTGNHFKWSYSNPVYKEQTAQTDEANSDITIGENAPPPPAKPFIHVVKINNNRHVNIVIEIRQ